MSVETVHAVGNRDLGQLGTGASNIVVIDVNHAELRLQLHSLREECHELVQRLFSVGHGRVIHKNDAMSVLLNWGPALLVLEIARAIPQLYVDLAEICYTWGRIALEVNDSTQICLVNSFLTNNFSGTNLLRSFSPFILTCSRWWVCIGWRVHQRGLRGCLPVWSSQHMKFLRLATLTCSFY